MSASASMASGTGSTVEQEQRAAIVALMRERDAAQDESSHRLDMLVTAREQRDAAYAAIRGLFENCSMVHKHWGEGSNVSQADAAIALARALVQS